MEREYIDIPLYTTFEDISSKNFSLSATQYKTFSINNQNVVAVGDFLSRNLKRSDLGSEVGSNAYVECSDYSFIKTKALQPESYLLDVTPESVQQITPSNFVDSNLKKGDLLISKDSNVGEMVILDRDYPDTMLCGGIYKLPVTQNKYYLLAFIKNDIFRQQIDFLVPRGSTIRHGKTKFLECLIPLPNKNAADTVKYVELLMQGIINKEVEIKKKYEQFLDEIRMELESNQKEAVFSYSLPTISEIVETSRLDSSLYSMQFKREEFLLDNYKYGTSSISELGFEFVRGNNLAISVIGHSIYSDTYQKGFYRLILPKNISRYGTLQKIQYLGNKERLLEVQKGSILFGAEGTFRSVVLIEAEDRCITNFHGLSICPTAERDISKSIFVKLMLDYFNEKQICKACATGGNGGSLSIQYWKYLKFPNFPDAVKERIVSFYHNQEAVYDTSKCTPENFLEYDKEFNLAAGIYELDKSRKYLQSKLDQAIICIANDAEVNIAF